ncbi:MAG: complex I NDUFA9 subunit family protein [Alphaproteobacteria bacterium]
MATRLATIFGGSGFAGRHIVRELAARGYRMRIAVRSPDSALFLKPMGDVGQITPVAAPITDDARIQAVCAGADVVINLVGILYEHGRQRFQDVHVDGARRVALAARAGGAAKLIHMSALGADPHSQANYSRSKAQGEAEVRKAFAQAVILRPSVMFGPEDDFFNKFAGLTRLLPVLPVMGVRYKPGDLKAGRLLGDGGPKFQPVHVGDVASAVARLVDDPRLAGQLFELGGPRVYTMQEIMELVLRHTGKRRLLVPVPFPLARFQAALLGLLPRPPLTRDQIRMMQTDNVLAGSEPGFESLGIEPIGPEAVLPRYLDRFRAGGRFSTYHA